jgi:hypothetical protein
MIRKPVWFIQYTSPDRQSEYARTEKGWVYAFAGINDQKWKFFDSQDEAEKYLQGIPQNFMKDMKGQFSVEPFYK